MPAKNNHPYSQIGVFEYIQDNKGTRYQCNKLARVFHCDTDDMRDTLDALVAKKWIETASSGRARLFFIRTAEESKVIDALDVPKSINQYRQSGSTWDAIRQKIADIRAVPSLYASLEKT